jgi:hypothetical protein
MRTLPALVAQGVTVALEVLTTAGALAWAAPAEWRTITALAAVTLLLPLVAHWFFVEPDLRIQTHAGALNGFVLNGLLGLTPIRIHGAERSLRRGQEALLVEWTRARSSLQALSVAFEGTMTTATYGLAMWLVYSYLRTSTRASLVLLLVFWALRFPALGQRLMVLTRTLPSVMNRARRLFEMIGAVDPAPATADLTVAAPAARARTGRAALLSRSSASA